MCRGEGGEEGAEGIFLFHVELNFACTRLTNTTLGSLNEISYRQAFKLVLSLIHTCCVSLIHTPHAARVSLSYAHTLPECLSYATRCAILSVVSISFETLSKL